MYSKFIDKLDLPNKLNLPENLTFGVEIEFENIKFSSVCEALENLKRMGKIDSGWLLKLEFSLDAYNSSALGGEIVSPVLTDIEKSYEEIEIICKMIIDMNGKITPRCGGHIHIGANVYEKNLLYYGRLARLWTVFEKEIIKFGFGEFDSAREMMNKYASFSSLFLRYIDDFENGEYGSANFENFVESFGFEKKLAISFYYLNESQPINTIEIRCPNGTLDYRIWKNNINFFTKLILACRDDSKDWNLIEEMFQEEKNKDLRNCIYGTDCFSKAETLANFIFDNETDIKNFLLQYKKDNFKCLIR